MLSMLAVSPTTRHFAGPIARHKRAELLRHVQQRLEIMPRTPEPKVSVPRAITRDSWLEWQILAEWNLGKGAVA